MSFSRTPICPNCRKSQTIRSPTNELICMNCGTEIDGNYLVSEVTFGETSSGAAMVTGSYLGADQSHISSGGRMQGGRIQGGHGESRAQTLEKTKRRIASIAAILNIPEHVSSSALDYFKHALDNSFVKGRRSQYVVSACLYLACRICKTQHMLMDFAEVICVNVFAIGATYLQLIRCIGIQKEGIPLTDPTLYVQRFTMALEFGDSEKQVRDDAAKVVSRMGKDWLTQGRRPAGIAAAAVIIAARMNNFRRSKLEVVQIAKIAEETIQRRLDEFKNTGAARLTITDFRNSNIESQSDPPSFQSKHNRLKKAHDQLSKESQEKNDTEDVYLNEELVRMADEIRELEEKEQKERELQKEQEKQELKKLKQSQSPSADVEQAEEGLEHDVDVILEDPTFKRASRAEIFLKKYRKEKELQKKRDQEALEAAEKAAEKAVNYEPWVSQVRDDPENLSDISDDEIDSFILTKEESELKKRVWMTLNADYLIDEEKRRLKREADIAAGIYKPKKRRKPRNNTDATTAAAANEGSAPDPNQEPNAEENAKSMLASRPISRKLNYDVVHTLFAKDNKG